MHTQFVRNDEKLSPSVRRVWIEMINYTQGRSTRSSPSVRRVWIEITGDLIHSQWLQPVTLRAEGVDRNKAEKERLASCQKSPSVRRVWIEITPESPQQFEDVSVTLRAEGVDRNTSDSET